MSEAIEIVAISCGACALGALSTRSRLFGRLAYEAGKKAGLRTAIDLLDIRADIAAETAPKGRLGIGFMRAQTLRDVAIELRRILAEVRP